MKIDNRLSDLLRAMARWQEAAELLLTRDVTTRVATGDVAPPD